MAKFKRNCDYCGMYYEGYGAKYCSPKCATQINNRNPEKIEKIVKVTSKTLEQRYWEKVIKGKDINDCWKWKATKSEFGYGYMNHKKKTLMAHRASYMIHYGKIKEGLSVLHKCDNPECSNPLHLFLGTQTENMQDMMEKKRYPNGSNHPKSKITEEEVMRIKNLRVEGNTYKEIAKIMKVDYSNVRNILSGNTWKHIEIELPILKNKRNVKISNEQIIEIRRLREGGLDIKSITDIFNISNSYARRICSYQVRKEV